MPARSEPEPADVVNMFLTGFDATTLNALWVDKDLRAHGLIQAFSRTNRILNSVRDFGNIVCFFATWKTRSTVRLVCSATRMPAAWC